MKVKLFLPNHIFRPAHGPQVWPWWRLLTFTFVKMSVHLPSTGYGLWLYTRWGAVVFEIYFDRRSEAAA